MQEIDSLWAEWEIKRNMFSLKFGDCPIWEYIRFNIYTIVAKHLGTEVVIGYYYRIPDNQNSKKGLQNQFLFKKKDILFFNMSRRQLVDGELVSPFLDGLLEEIPYSYTVLECRNKTSIDERIKTKNLCCIDIDSMAVKYIWNDKWENTINKIVRMLERDFKIKLSKGDIQEIRNTVSAVISNRKRFLMYFRCMLLQMRPKLVVVLGNGLQYVNFLIEAARGMNIPVAEYEHGVLGQNFVMACTYKKLLVYPEYLLTYTNFENTVIDDCYISEEKRIAIGNVYHDRRVLECKKEREKIGKRKRKNILYISNGEKNSRTLTSLKILMDELGGDYQLLIKVRGEEWRVGYSDLIKNGAEIVGNKNQSDIYEFLVKADYLIGEFGSTFVEAAELGIPTIVLPYSYNFQGNRYCDAGYAIWGEDIKEIARNIKNDDLMTEAKKIYQENPIESFCDFVDRFM